MPDTEPKPILLNTEEAKKALDFVREFRPECVSCLHLVDGGNDRAACNAEICPFEPLETSDADLEGVLPQS